MHRKLIKKVTRKATHATRRATYSTIRSTKYLHSQFRQHASTAMIAAFSFLIAIAWKDLIVSIVKDSTNIALLEKYPYLPNLVTAIIVTIIAVIGIALISRWAKKE